MNIIGKPNNIIAEIKGFDTLPMINNRVIKANARSTEGSLIGEDGTTAQMVGCVFYKFLSSENAKEIANEILNQLTVKNEKGESIAWVVVK